MNKVFDYICYRCIERNLNENVVAVSVPEISKELNYSENFTRSLIRKLKEKELIKGVCESGYNEFTDRHVIVRGYALTEKATKTDSYQKALYKLTLKEMVGEYND